MSKKVFIIGLDGADFQLMNEFRKDLPNINKIINNGMFSILRSSIPNASTVAWASFLTCKNPGKHGIVDFVTRDSPTDLGTPVNSISLEGPSMWKILSQKEKKCIVFGVPLTYPPEGVNGILIGGFPLPHDADDYIYPRELVKEFISKGWNFADLPTASYSRDKLPEFLKELHKRIEEKTQACLHLLEKHDWDLFVVHYFETDKVQHEFLNYKYRGIVDENSFKKYKNVVKNFYISMDRVIGRLLEKIDLKETIVFIVSDHGFSPNENLIFLDAWLLKKGYIKLKDNFFTKMKYFLFKLGLTPINIFRYLPVKLKSKMLEVEDEKYYSEKDSKKTNIIGKLLGLSDKIFLNKVSDVEWSKTRAYCYGSTGIANIFLNLEMMNENSEINPKSMGKEIEEINVFDEIYIKKEIYSGDHCKQLPDIAAFQSSFKGLTYNHPTIFLSNKIVIKNYLAPDRATHNMNGIFIVAGPDIEKTKERINADIIDIFPTVLNLFGVPIPTDVDGKVLSKIIKTKSKVTYAEYKEDKRKDYKASDKDKKDMLERLKRMGYL